MDCDIILSNLIVYSYRAIDIINNSYLGQVNLIDEHRYHSGPLIVSNNLTTKLKRNYLQDPEGNAKMV